MKYLLAVLFLLTGCPAQAPEVAYPEQARQRVEVVLDATVALMNEDHRVFCAGVLHGSYVLTAYHCVDDLDGGIQLVGFRSQLSDGSWEDPWEYRLIEGDALTDIAVLSPESPQAPHGGLELSPENAWYGDRVITVGHPLGWLYTLTTGRVSHPKRLMSGGTWLQISAPVSPGNSGGPVLNEYSEIIGIVSFRLTSGFLAEAHLAGAVHLDTIKAALGE